MKTPRLNKLKAPSAKKRKLILIYSGVFGLFGAAILVLTFAATSNYFVEPETSTLSGNASIVADATASGGNAVKFTQASGTGSCPVATANVPDGPDPWGGCFPGPSTSGVPAGTVLTNYTGCTGSDGEALITAANTVIDSKTINCDVIIMASNVTIKNSKIIGLVMLDVDRVGSNTWSVIVENTDIDAGARDLPGIFNGNMKVYRSNLHGGHNGFQCDSIAGGCVLQDSYIHAQYQPSNFDSHLGGLLSDGTVNLSLIHNSVFCDVPINNVGGGCTGDINLIPNFRSIDGATIDKNLLGANKDSSYCTYGGEKSSSPTPNSYNIRYTNNVFQKGITGHCAGYGAVTNFNYANTGNVWTNNKYDDGTTILCDATHDCN